MKNKEIAKMWIEGNREEVKDIIKKDIRKNYNLYIRNLNSILEILFYYDMETEKTFCKDFSDMLKAEKLVF